MEARAAEPRRSCRNQSRARRVSGERRIDSYQVVFELGTPRAVIQAIVGEREFPADAVPGEAIDLGICSLQVWRSPTLEAEVGDGRVASVAYFGNDPLVTIYLGTGQPSEC